MSGEQVPQALRLRYLASLPGKADEFERVLADALAASPPNWSGLRALAHKLAGSAGMYGYDQLGDRARELVHEIDTRSGSAESLSAQTLALVAALRAT